MTHWPRVEPPLARCRVRAAANGNGAPESLFSPIRYTSKLAAYLRQGIIPTPMSRPDRSVTKLSVNQFTETLRTEVEQEAKENGLDYSKEADRGTAFQRWAARLFIDYEGYDSSPEDSILVGSGDLKADIVLDDETRKHLLIAQCKFASLSKRPTVDETQVADFFRRHSLYQKRDWIQKHGSVHARELLLDYNEKLIDDYKVTFVFITTADATPRVTEMVDALNEEYQRSGMPVTCELLHFSALKDYYVRARTAGQPGPEEVHFKVKVGGFFEKQLPRKTLVALIGGAMLRNLYKQYKETLFNWNIRGYLGKRGINEDIRKTAEERPEDFFYFNNGISAICTEFELDEKSGQVVAHGFQIINGAQTLGTLARSDPKGELEVLFRLTKGLEVKSEKGFNRDIIQFNNTQNVIKVSDFRANDAIQAWLAAEFERYASKSHIPRIRYVPKRTFKRVPGAMVVRLEDLAKIRYAFLYEPTLIHAKPRGLWTLAEDGGEYEKAFGENGDLVEVWSPETFRQAVLAIAFYAELDERTKQLAKQNLDNRFHRRLRFHTLALIGIALRAASPARVQELLTDGAAFAKEWELQSTRALELVSDMHTELEDTTMFAFVRNPSHWDKLAKKLQRRLDIGAKVEPTGSIRKSTPPPRRRG